MSYLLALLELLSFGVLMLVFTLVVYIRGRSDGSIAMRRIIEAQEAELRSAGFHASSREAR